MLLVPYYHSDIVSSQRTGYFCCFYKEDNLKIANPFLYTQLTSIDSSIILEKPKLAPYIEEMRNNVASLLECDKECVSIKAQTNEKCGEVGKEEAVECQAIVLLQKK